MEDKRAVRELAREIVQIISPVKIFLFSRKTSLSGEITSFKLCVVVDDDVGEDYAMDRIYTDCDCDLPYDIVIYRNVTWAEMSERQDTFAYSVAEKGELIYER